VIQKTSTQIFAEAKTKAILSKAQERAKTAFKTPQNLLELNQFLNTYFIVRDKRFKEARLILGINQDMAILLKIIDNHILCVATGEKRDIAKRYIGLNYEFVRTS